MELTVSKEIIPAAATVTPHTLAVASLFGIGLDDTKAITLFKDVTIPLAPGSIVLITGPSGSGKSSLLQTLREQIGALPGIGPALSLTDIPLAADCALVDTFDLPLSETLEHLARAGLSDAFILLRKPSELSDGQRFRYRLARATASSARFLFADEFAATLDRLTAKILSYQLRKTITRTQQTAILATTHEDLEDDLQPDVLVLKHLGKQCDVKVRQGKQEVRSR